MVNLAWFASPPRRNPAVPSTPRVRGGRSLGAFGRALLRGASGGTSGGIPRGRSVETSNSRCAQGARPPSQLPSVVPVPQDAPQQFYYGLLRRRSPEPDCNLELNVARRESFRDPRLPAIQPAEEAKISEANSSAGSKDGCCTRRSTPSSTDEIIRPPLPPAQPVLLRRPPPPLLDRRHSNSSVDSMGSTELQTDAPSSPGYAINTPRPHLQEASGSPARIGFSLNRKWQSLDSTSARSSSGRSSKELASKAVSIITDTEVPSSRCSSVQELMPAALDQEASSPQSQPGPQRLSGMQNNPASPSGLLVPRPPAGASGSPRRFRGQRHKSLGTIVPPDLPPEPASSSDTGRNSRASRSKYIDREDSFRRSIEDDDTSEVLMSPRRSESSRSSLLSVPGLTPGARPQARPTMHEAVERTSVRKFSLTFKDGSNVVDFFQEINAGAQEKIDGADTPERIALGSERDDSDWMDKLSAKLEREAMLLRRDDSDSELEDYPLCNAPDSADVPLPSPLFMASPLASRRASPRQSFKKLSSAGAASGSGMDLSHLLTPTPSTPRCSLDPFMQDAASSTHTPAASTRQSPMPSPRSFAPSTNASRLPSRQPSRVGSLTSLPPLHTCEGQVEGGPVILDLERDFRVGETLGVGSFGRVFAAQHKRTGLIVAVKEILFERTGDEERDRREPKCLERELLLCEKLRHPCIVRYLGHELGPAPDGGKLERLLLFLEYCSGGSVASNLKKYGPLEEPVCRRYARQLLEGLHYLHTRSPPVVHRDLKCANLLLTHDSNMKIADFGCSKWLKEGTDSLRQRKEKDTVVGSVFWAAPEVLEGISETTTAVDIWSFGACLLEMATARHPWAERETDNIFQACKLILSENELPEVPEHLPVEIQGVIMACIKRNPLDRATATSLWELPLFDEAIA